MRTNLPNPDELVLMSQESYDAFVSAGCIPECHCCAEKIHIGMYYRLATVSEQQASQSLEEIPDIRYRPFKVSKEHQVMICHRNECSTEKMLDDAISLWQKIKRYQDAAYRIPSSHRTGGCFIVDGRVVT